MAVGRVSEWAPSFANGAVGESALKFFTHKPCTHSHRTVPFMHHTRRRGGHRNNESAVSSAPGSPSPVALARKRSQSIQGFERFVRPRDPSSGEDDDDNDGVDGEDTEDEPHSSNKIEIDSSPKLTRPTKPLPTRAIMPNPNPSLVPIQATIPRTATQKQSTRRLIVVLEQACLEAYKISGGGGTSRSGRETKEAKYALLNCDDHQGILAKTGRDIADARPDITHQVCCYYCSCPGMLNTKRATLSAC